jgi:hypothetical protein
MLRDESPRALISYAHGSDTRDRKIRDLADCLRRDGVECDLDQYHESPEHGWPTWMSAAIADARRTIVVVASDAYLRRWTLAEESGIGLGAKYEGKLIRQVLYEAEGFNGRVVPVVLEHGDVRFVPLELRDVTRYDVSDAAGYDRLLRRLTGQPLEGLSAVGPAIRLLGSQDTRIAGALFLLQMAPAPLPLDVVGDSVGLSRDELESQFLRPPLAEWATVADDLLSTTYYRPVAPAPQNPTVLLSNALRGLLRHCRERGSVSGPIRRAQLTNVLHFGEQSGVSPEILTQVFKTLQTPLKSLGDKRLVWRAAELTIRAASRVGRTEEDLREEALALICGRSWVLQRVNMLEEAAAAARRSLEIGEELHWSRNTAFCHKCLGRLSRLRAEAASDCAERERLLEESQESLKAAILAFEAISDADRDREIGECRSLMARTHLVAGRLKDARNEADIARNLIHSTASKEYRDLLIVLGELAMSSGDLKMAEGFFTEAAGEPHSLDTQVSEVRARAIYARGICNDRLAQRSRARADFAMAADIWKALQDPNQHRAEWKLLTLETHLEVPEDALRNEKPAVRVRAVEIQRERLKAFGNRPARRNAALDSGYLSELIDEARRVVAVQERNWVEKITSPQA